MLGGQRSRFKREAKAKAADVHELLRAIFKRRFAADNLQRQLKTDFTILV
jgi:hypothetical protein